MTNPVRNLVADAASNVATQPVPRLSDYRRRWAVVVGVSYYGDFGRTRLQSLPNAANDACRLFEVLTRGYECTGTLLCRTDEVVAYEQMAGIPAGTLTPSVAGNGSRTDIVDAVDAVARLAAPEDLFIFFYSGHGTGEGGGFIVPYGAVRDRHSTYLMYETFWAALGSLPCRHKLLLFDCCYAGIVRPEMQSFSSEVKAGGSTGIVLGERVAILSATDAFTVAPDRYQCYATGGRPSCYSPFTEALVEKLESAQPGEELLPESIFLHDYRRVTEHFLPQPVDGVAIRPAFSAIGTGRLTLRKPGLHIDAPGLIWLKRGEHHTERLEVSGGSNPYNWAVEDAVPGCVIDSRSGVLSLDGKAVEPGKYIVTVRVTDCTGNAVARSVRLLVQPQEDIPLAISTKRLDPCFAGSDYRVSLQAEGGNGALAWRVNGLPDGLVCSSLEGTIRGVVSRECLASSGGSYVFALDLEVTDSRGVKAREQVCLAVVDLEKYCEVPAGMMLLGYHPTPDREKELARLTPNGELKAAVCSNLCVKGEVYLPRFFIKRYPVTNREWREFVQAQPSAGIPRRWAENDFNSEREADLPVTDVSLKDMQAYCRWRGTRLPTGWEWEKAARGEDGRLFPWGDKFDVNRCNSTRLRWGALTFVDQFPEGASPFGTLDMSGNAWEVAEQRICSYGRWRQALRGGSYREEASAMLACMAAMPEQGWRLNLDERQGVLVPADSATDPAIGFRDVIEVEDAPVYPQGLVPVAQSHFVIPDSRKELCAPKVFLARYTVTNTEYAEFVRETRHSRPRHWNQSGTEYFGREMRYLPVIHVTWDDAVAFCRWKSGRVGVVCKVMTERVWRAAVHGPGHGHDFAPHKYPWGNDWHCCRCNGRDSGFGGPVRVFDLADGRALCGVFHLLGNVWQWVGPNKVAGGSWQENCHATEDWLRECDGARCDVGFRYYAEAPSTH